MYLNSLKFEQKWLNYVIFVIILWFYFYIGSKDTREISGANTQRAIPEISYDRL